MRFIHLRSGKFLQVWSSSAPEWPRLDIESTGPLLDEIVTLLWTDAGGILKMGAGRTGLKEKIWDATE